MNKKKVCFILALLLSLSNVIATAEEVPDNEGNLQNQEDKEIKANKETYEKAQEAMKNKDFASAIVYLTIYINSKSKKYEAYKLRGECFYELRQYKLAQNDFETAIKLKTDDDKFITGTKVLGAVVLGADKSEQYQNPELGKLYANLMYAQKAQNNVSYENSYQKAGEYNSHLYLPKIDKNEITKINCPQKYGKKVNVIGIDKSIYDAIDDIAEKNYNEAIYKAQNITQEYPKYFLGYYLTGVALVGLDNEKEAISAFETALKYNQYDFESMASLGQIYYTDAEKIFSADLAQKSIEYFKEALKYNPNINTYHYYIGLNNLQIGNLDEAISSFNSAIKIKQNDYNSIYYKAIAQYLKGDNEAVIDSANKLLYRHVSNYNSVLYLKALAEYNLEKDELALSDIEKIQNNMNDIYNIDLKELTPKEKTLESYVYYLKAKINQDKGFGAKADYDTAYQNSIIKKLANSDTDITLTSEDLENQYDYIRTTFKNSNLKFVYSNLEYKLVSNTQEKDEKTIIPEIKNMEEENLALFVPIKEENKNENKIEMKESTDSIDTLVDENENSIAKMLAINNFITNEKIIKNEETQTDKVVENLEQPEPIEQQEIKQVEENLIVEEPKEIKEFTITYPKDDTIQFVENEVAKLEEPVKKVETTVNTDSEQVPKIVEKHAQVDLNEFNIKQAEPEIKETDEVIVFEPTNFISRAEQDLSKNLLSKQTTEKVETVKEMPDIRPAAIIDVEEIINNNTEEISIVEKTVEKNVSDNAMTQDIIAEELIIPVASMKNKEEKISTKTKETVEKEVLSEKFEEPENLEKPINETETTEVESENNIVEKDINEQQGVVKSEKSKKTKVKKDKQKKTKEEQIVQTEIEKSNNVEEVTDEEVVEQVKTKKVKKAKKESKNKKNKETEKVAKSIIQTAFLGEVEKPAVETCEVSSEKEETKIFEETTSTENKESVEETEIDLTPAVTYVKDIKKEKVKKNKTKNKFSLKNLFKRNKKEIIEEEIIDEKINTNGE